ncbi:B-cell receptor CD22-like [Cebidichthys violaceus]|uniref:B-cell receptor CD22-like n=1 Tax=Cebidichthys violaceus TaxID=271503 RepID=UPI0035CCA4F0
MGPTAAAGGFVVFLLFVPVVQGQAWGVIYSSEDICATRGSTVNMSCTFTHPSHVTVREKFWHTKEVNGESFDLMGDSDYTDRVEYICDTKHCTLRIVDLKDSDATTYKFRFIGKQSGEKWTGEPGVKLDVTVLQMHVTRVTINISHTEAELSCSSTCGRPSYVWFKNGQKVPEEAAFYTAHLKPGDGISCALKGHEDHRLPPLYAPKSPSVSVSPSAEVMEDSSVNLTCSGDANIVANYTWYKEDENKSLSKEPHLVFSSIQSSDSGQYYCRAVNQLGMKRSESISIDVKYAPKNVSVSVSPSGEIVEGSSVILTCSSDANPAASYIWYKKNQIKLQGPEGVYRFTSISSEDRGIYYCKSENQYGRITSSEQFIDVQYAPKLPSVSVSPSAEIVEGSSVTLTCSSDANPAANYTWYKEGEDSPKTSGQTFNITDFRAEHSGSYYCEAQNNRGRHRSTVHLAVLAEGWILIAAGTVSAILILVILVSVSLWIRKKRASKEPPEPTNKPDNRAQVRKKQPAEKKEGLHYACINFSKKQADPLYSNITPSQAPRHKKEENVDSVEYATVKFNSGNTLPGNSQETGDDPDVLYSTVNTTSEKQDQNL